MLQGNGSLFSSPDADQARRFFATKRCARSNKLMTSKQAVEKFIPDDCYLAIGGFGTNRIPTPVLHDILRFGRKNLAFLGHTSTHDFQILAAGKCFNRVDAAYIVGLEARGLSPNARRIMQSGEVKVCEWTNYALAIRLKAAAEGNSFGVSRTMLGTDTFKASGAKVIQCPYTGKKYCAFPALWPDVCVIHVHEADVFGNARINGISVADLELARASKRVIITAERIVPNEEIRRSPNQTAIPHLLVDAVVEAPFGSYPGNMPYEYLADEGHLGKWMQVEKDPEVFAEFLREYIYETKDFHEYLEKCGGMDLINKLRHAENANNQ